MQLAGVRRQLEEARAALLESAAHATAAAFDPAYRAALKSRNLLFHATRGLAAARGEELPAMPVTAGESGALDDHIAALTALAAALAVPDDDARAMPVHVDTARGAYARYLAFLRNELGKTLQH